jgi:AcrR family transcriptional regulator
LPRAGLSHDAVVDVAWQLVDEEGPAALTLAAVANRAGVATPSLYKHVRNLAELRIQLSIRAIDELSAVVGEAVQGRSGDDAVRALMAAYRAYVLEHPHRYASMIQSPEPELAESGSRLLDIVLSALRGYDLDPADAIHAARCLRAAAHGFAVLETAGGFGLPELVDHSYGLLTSMVISGLKK